MATQNPLASLITVPVENNGYFDTGPYDRYQNMVKFKPAIPFSMAKELRRLVRRVHTVGTRMRERSGFTRVLRRSN